MAFEVAKCFGNRFEQIVLAFKRFFLDAQFGQSAQIGDKFILIAQYGGNNLGIDHIRQYDSFNFEFSLINFELYLVAGF